MQQVARKSVVVVVTDQGGAGGTREPRRATRLRVSDGAEGGRSQEKADRDPNPEAEPPDPLGLALLVVA